MKLRVPLQRRDVTFCRVFAAYRFHDAVVDTEGFSFELGRQVLDALVVNAVDAHPLNARVQA